MPTIKKIAEVKSINPANPNPKKVLIKSATAQKITNPIGKEAFFPIPNNTNAENKSNIPKYLILFVFAFGKITLLSCRL